MGRKRSPGSNPTVWWALAVAVAAVFGWLIWRTSQGPRAATKASSTNSLDWGKATNLLQWLNTNFVASTNLASEPVVPPVTNRVPTKRLPIVVTNLLTAVTNRPRTNLFATTPPSPPSEIAERPVRNFLEAQIALARLAISCGPIDGLVGYQTRAALRAFQVQNELPPSGDLDAATKEALTISEPIFTNYVITPPDLARLHPVPATWVEKSQLDSLDFETALELVAEKHQSSHGLIKSLNPGMNWTNMTPFTSVKVPYVPHPAPERAAFIRIALAAKTLEAFDSETNLLAHFPCSIAARVEKRPAGRLTVVTGASNPNYTFDPAVFPESEEARHIDHKLIIPPGPNNPVGVAWISLDKPGYGIHGTPRPEQVGRTESHGCFRLANWNAEYLLKIVWAGLPVYVEP
jgi:lipoprotein-anchoring transpeptidase ErfK/SrfK